MASASAESFGSIDPTTIRDLLEKGHEGFDASIEISEVGLFYPGASAPALAGVSLTLRAGQSLALVGPTGAGKSTLADVILGVLIPDSGEALIGGLPPAESLANWPGAVAYVPQDVAMANGTVRENVALGLPSEIIDDEWVWDALNRAHLGDFLRDSREGINTVIGENGMKLSGGQRQRLGIARALYTRPKLLVLDEATSALDAETEQAISRTLQELEGTVTTVTIAHRLATIRHCDLVAYLEGGKALAQGTFDEVRAATPQFERQAQLLGL
jgi:ABC-type multidrug transport system fused ATPase/permease subunit